MMREALRRIPFEEFADNLVEIFERVIDKDEAVLVESDTGALVEVRPVAHTNLPRHEKTAEDYEAFLATAGGWADVDVDTFLKHNDESRRLNTRPSVEL
jgi:hypothetical protein